MLTSCLDCGTPSPATRCAKCDETFRRGRYRKQTEERKKRGGRPGYGGGYRRAASSVRALASRCWICGDGPRPDDPFQADHVTPLVADPYSTFLLPAHRSCNVGRSNRERDDERKNRTRGRGTRTPDDPNRSRTNRSDPPRTPEANSPPGQKT